VKSVAVVNRADVQQSPSWVRRTDAQNARNHDGRRPAEHAHVLATDATDSYGNLGPPSLSSAFAEEPQEEVHGRVEAIDPLVGFDRALAARRSPCSREPPRTAPR
jgi:hypothetical protein